MNYKKKLYDNYVNTEQAGAHVLQGDTNFSANAPYAKHLIKNHIPSEDKDIFIVDLGCGHGTFIHFFKKAGYRNIIGIDISEEQINLGHQLGISEVKHGDIFDFLRTQEDASIDVCLMMDIIEHLDRASIFNLIDLVAVKLKPKGRVLVHVPNGEGVFGMKIRYGDLTHEMAFTSTSLRQLFKTAKFNKINCYEERPIVHGVKSFIRRLLFVILLFPYRLLALAESASYHTILSRNILCVAIKNGNA